MSDPLVCAITGASAGIGKAVAVHIAKMGYRVLVLAREGDKAHHALEEIKASSGSDDVHLFSVDLASLSSVRAVAEKVRQNHDRLDVLINNAGVYKRTFQTSADGHEMTVAVNYLAPFLLTNLLLPLLERSDAGRVVNVTSAIYPRGDDDLDGALAPLKFKGDRAYATSKKLLVMFTLALARRLEGASSVTANVVHPGVAGSEVFREYPSFVAKLINLFVKKPEDVVAAEVKLATDPALAGVSGRYFYETEERELEGIDVSAPTLARLWTHTAEVVELDADT